MPAASVKLVGLVQNRRIAFVAPFVRCHKGRSMITLADVQSMILCGPSTTSRLAKVVGATVPRKKKGGAGSEEAGPFGPHRLIQRDSLTARNCSNQ